MFNFFNKFKSPQAAAPQGAGTSPAKVAEQPDEFGLVMRIADDRYGVTELKQVHPSTSTALVRESPRQFYCLDMEEFGLEEAVRWIREVRHLEPSDTRRVPVVFLIGPPRSMSSREWRVVNEQLKPAGGYFYKPPDYNATFETTMRSLRDELIKQYGPPGRRDAWRHPQPNPDLVAR